MGVGGSLLAWALLLAAAPAATPSLPGAGAPAPGAPLSGAPLSGGAAPPAAAVTACSTVDWRARQLVVHAEVTPPGRARLWRDVSALAQGLAERAVARELVRAVAQLPLGAAAATPAATLAQAPAWRDYVAQAARHFTVSRSDYAADGQVALTARLPLEGGAPRLGALWAALYAARPSLEAARAGVLPALPQAAPVRVALTARAPTGVVLQATGDVFAPSLWPRVVDRHGRLLYGADNLRPDAMAARGVATLHDDLQAALRDPRVAEHAVVLTARPRRPGSHDLLVDDAEATQLQALGGLLEEGRVAFVVTLPPPQGCAGPMAAWADDGAGETGD